MTVDRAIKATERSLKLSALRAYVRAAAAVAPDRAARSVARRFFTTARPEPGRMQFAAGPAVGELDVPDGRVATYRWGDADAPAVLLAHGWSGWAQQLEAFVAPIVERGHAVLAFDHVAHGASRGAQTTLPAMIRSTEHVLARTPNVVGAVAHSLGAAAVASVLSSTRRELAGAVLIAPPSDPRPYLAGLARMIGTPDRLLGRVREHAEAFAGVPFERLVMHPWRARMIRTPLLIVHDLNDRDVPIRHGYAYTSAAEARMIATDGLGHHRILRDRHVVDTAVDFVTRRVHEVAARRAA